MTEQMTETLVNDLLTRVKKLEEKEKTDVDVQNYLNTLDRVAFSMSVAIDVISKVIIEKGLISKEDLAKTLNDEKERISKEIQSQTAQQTENKGM
jgi:hypothetical protein